VRTTGSIPDFAGVERLWMNHTKALLNNALLFGLLTATCALSAQQENPHSYDAQEPIKSLGEIAREAKKNKAVRAKAVITEETLSGQEGPLPKLSLEGPENNRDIVLVIGDYKARHTDQQTEQMVHHWYSESDSMLATLFRENMQLQSLRESNTYYSSEGLPARH
jgi:hypothetical protein